MVQNQVQLIGNVGKDPTIRVISENNSVASFSLATSDKHKDKDGNLVDKTDWHNIVIFGKLCGIVEKYVKKGTKLAVSGKIQYRDYTDKEGNKKYITEIIVSEMMMLDGKRTTESSEEQPISNSASENDDYTDDFPF